MFKKTSKINLDKWQKSYRPFKIQNIAKQAFSFKTLPPSSCLSHLTLLVCQLDSLSSRDKWNLICDVTVIRHVALSSRVQFLIVVSVL